MWQRIAVSFRDSKAMFAKLRGDLARQVSLTRSELEPADTNSLNALTAQLHVLASQFDALSMQYSELVQRIEQRREEPSVGFGRTGFSTGRKR
jgi:hypothetical protein